MRCQSPNGLYKTDIKGDQSQSKRCYNIEIQEKQGRIWKMNKNQIERFNKAKDMEEEVPEDGSAK